MKYQAQNQTKGYRSYKAGELAGTLDPDGYLYVEIDGVDYPVHKLIYLIEYGEYPDNIIHLNGNKLDNRIQNLRAI